MVIACIGVRPASTISASSRCSATPGMRRPTPESEPSSARERRHIDATPFSHAPCSVLSGEPCTPSTCSVFNHGPCIPEIDYPYSENLQVTIQSQPSQDDATKYQKPDHDLNTIGDLFAALRSCWSPPPADAAREGMLMSVLFSFKKSGAMIAPPRMTFATQGALGDKIRI
jgi:hypothetical protein